MDINIPSQIKLFANLSSFPLTGEVKTLYIDQSTANHYYWSGSAYVQLKDGTKFPIPTGTTAQYLRGDGSLETFPSIPSIAGLVPETRTINGLDLSANRVLTASDVGAPSGSGTSSGTNTGDETQASILAKLGMFRIDFPPSSPVTGTTAYTQVLQATIPANSIKSTDNLRIMIPIFKTGTGGITNVRVKLSTSNTLPSGTTDQIGQASGTNTNLYVPFIRQNASFNGGNLNIFSPTTNANSDLAASNAAPASIGYDRTQPLYLYVEIQLINSGDSAYLAGGYITNM
jgi:hypothetical protein